jgi:hypothetical protein
LEEFNIEDELNNIGVGESLRQFLKFNTEAGLEDLKFLEQTLKDLGDGTILPEDAEQRLQNVIDKLNEYYNLKKDDKENDKQSAAEFIDSQLESGRILEETYGNLANGFTDAFGVMRIRASEAASETEKAFISMGNSIIQMIQRILVEWALLNLFSFITGGTGVGLAKVAGLSSGGTVTNAGNGTGTIQPHQKFSSGVTNFNVPSGYSKDDYLVGVSTGEKVTVTPKGGQSSSDGLSSLSNKLEAQNANLISSLNLFARILDSKELNSKLSDNGIVISYERGQKQKRRIR